ncbi:MAG: SPASM domain-containing protein [Anaerolineales bacterium]
MELNNAAVPGFPPIVNVEVFRGRCPCRCGHCPVGVAAPSQRRQLFGEGCIELGLFQKIVEEIASYSTPVLRIHSTGEPLLWENFPGALKMLKENGVKSWLFTSAVTRDKAILKSICEAVSIIEVSVNSITVDDYLATKGVDAFDLVTENIRYMRSLVGNDRSKRLIVSRVESDQAELDEAFVRYWRASDLVDDAFVRSYHTYNDLLPETACSPLSSPKIGPCLVHWARFNIGLTGQAVVCFNELFKTEVHPSLIVGDVNKQAIAEIWKGPTLTALRLAELSGDYSGLSHPEVLPCKDCTHCQPLFNNSRETSEHQLGKIGVDA